MDEITFYLPFPDGVLQYVCAECDALCCRGQGFGGSLSREMKRLLTLYPALQNAVTGRRGELLWFQSPTGRCYFLEDDKFCRIEKEHGKATKPGVCGLFPFNKFGRLGDDIVTIGPHFLCPLRVITPARPGSVEGTHSKVIAAAKESAMLDGAYFASDIPPLPLASKQTPKEALTQEEKFRDECAKALTQKTFSSVLRAATQDPKLFDEHLRRASLLCGVVPAERAQRDGLDDTLLALASSWRLNMLHIGQERMLRVLGLADLLLRRLSVISGRALTPQQTNHGFNELMPALRFLSRGDTPLTLPKSAQKVPPFGSAGVTFSAYRALRAAETKGLLTSLEETFPKELLPFDRMAILTELGAHTEQATIPKTRKK